MNHDFLYTTKKVSANPCTGRAPVHQGKRKHSRANSNLKQWWSFFFDIRGIVHVYWVSEGQTFNQVHYKEVLTNLRERVRRRRPEVWNSGSWVLHQDQYRHKTPCLSRRYWRSTRSPCWNIHRTHPMRLFLFPQIKSALKGTRFESVDAVKAKATELMNKLSEDDLQHCFQQWKIRMERCRDRGGEYIEGDSISIV